MPTTSLLTNQEAVTSIGADDGATPPVAKPASLSAQVSNFPNAYIALVGSNQLHFVAQQPGDFTVTINGHSQDLTPLPALVLNFHVDAPPVPQAKEITATDLTVKNQDVTTPANPGTDTITFSV